MKKRFLSLVLSLVMACSAPAASLAVLSQTSVETQAATTNGWVQSGSDWYYYKNGELFKGWLYYNKSWYFLDLQTGLMKANEWFLDQNGYMYYARSWGAIYQSTTVSINGRSYNFDLNGRISNTQWVQMDHQWYLIADRMPVKGWYLYQNNWYYMYEDGTMAANEKIKYNGSWYFLTSWGGMRHSGWYLEDGLWYYLRSWGAAVADGKYQVNNKWYYFYEDGVMASDVIIDDEYYNKDGVLEKKPTGSSDSSSTNTQCSSFAGLSEAEVVELVGPLATENQRETGILASITMAQFILESGYASTDLAQNANNCFGMKASLSGNTWPDSTWDGVSIYTKSSIEEDANGQEYYLVSDFRKYSCMEDSFLDHSAYLIGARCDTGLRYPGINTMTNYRDVAYLIYNGGYATSHTYPEYLCELIQRWNLTRFDL